MFRSLSQMVPLHHFYHIYADGLWPEPLEEHLHALKTSGLPAQPGFSFKVALVGSEENVAAVIEHLKRDSIRRTEIARAGGGWEQVTLTVLAHESHTLDGFVFYASSRHTVALGGGGLDRFAPAPHSGLSRF